MFRGGVARLSAVASDWAALHVGSSSSASTSAFVAAIGPPGNGTSFRAGGVRSGCGDAPEHERLHRRPHPIPRARSNGCRLGFVQSRRPRYPVKRVQSSTQSTSVESPQPVAEVSGPVPSARWGVMRGLELRLTPRAGLEQFTSSPESQQFSHLHTDSSPRGGSSIANS